MGTTWALSCGHQRRATQGHGLMEQCVIEKLLVMGGPIVTGNVFDS